jgi:hypothetical protein
LIPTLILVGLLMGRWYFVPVAAIAWAVILGLDGIISGVEGYTGAAVLGAANTAAGVALHQLIVRFLRGARSKIGLPLNSGGS